jgi:hypothetical protein
MKLQQSRHASSVSRHPQQNQRSPRLDHIIRLHQHLLHHTAFSLSLDRYLRLHRLQDGDDLLILEPVTHFDLHFPHVRIKGCLDSGDLGI